MFDLAQGLIEFFSCVLEILIAIFFFRAFQEPRYKRGIVASIALVVTVLFFVSRIYLKNSLMITVVTTLLTVLLAVAYRFKWYQAVFYALALSALSAASELFIGLAFQTANLAYHQMISSIVLNVIGIVLSKAVTVTVILLIYKKRERAFSHIKNSTFIQFMLLPISTILIVLIFYYYIFQNIGIPQWLSSVAVAAIFALIVSNILVFYLLDRQEEFRAMEERLRQVDLLLQAQKEYYDELCSSQQEIRRSRHDQKNLLIAILAELDHNNIPKLRRMINSRLDRLDRVLLINPRDSVLESILYVKQQSAKRHGIRIDGEIKLTKEPVADELELAVMLSNLLDNAVESLVRDHARDPIRCMVYEHGDNLMLVVENSVHHSVNVKNLATTKADKKYHGLGLPSVQTLVNENGGMLEITCENNSFVASIVLPNVN